MPVAAVIRGAQGDLVAGGAGDMVGHLGSHRGLHGHPRAGVPIVVLVYIIGLTAGGVDDASEAVFPRTGDEQPLECLLETRVNHSVFRQLGLRSGVDETGHLARP